MAVGGYQAKDSVDDPDATRIVLRADPPSGLPRGTRLRDFEIQSVVGEGGFSIVYAALDLNLRRRVALKEYMPATLARRGESRSVQPRTGSDSEVFDLGRRSFLNEARLLAQFDHPSLVKVLQFWEENGTAYMVMPLYEGRTLKQWLKARTEPPTEEELKLLVGPLLDALEHMHAESVFHRDIAPDNILLLGDGRPVLLDFGAARQVLADSDKALTAILKPSYAPIEQYADMGQLRQGPWTDVYALCAVLYFAITGAAPPSAVARSIADKMVPAVQAGSGRYSARFLRGIDAGLKARPEARPQTIAQLRALLLDAPATLGAPRTVGLKLVTPQPQPLPWWRHTGVLAAGATVLVGAIVGAIWLVVSGLTAGDAPTTGAESRGAESRSAEQQAPPAAPPAQPPAETSAIRTEAPPPAPRQEERAATPTPAPPVAPQPTTVAPPAMAPAPPAAAPAERRAAEPSRRPKQDAAARETPAAARARCLQILQRMQLSELPSPDDKAFMQKECS
jgi:serine/threonine protein kinase